MKPQSFPSGTLWSRVVERTEHGIRCGAIRSIPTDYEFVEQNGINFLVRVVSRLAKKDQAKKGNPNPFLPYDKDLFVANISETHVCLLNKFNVVDHHILIVTREFENQESLLTLNDFEAMWVCMGEFEGLAFYNAGAIAGASQQHKHLQMVPLPLAPEGPKVPLDPALESASVVSSK